MKQASRISQILTITLNSAFIGAMILIALVLVSFWRSSEPQVFLDWFTAHSSKIDRFMFPFGPGVLILATVSFFLNKENKILWGVTMLLITANILYYLIYFRPTNSSFAAQSIDIHKVSAELTTWLNFHWQRIFFAIGALITSILAVSRTMSQSNK
ncbi:MAG TPA: hypothetical protein DCS93_08340 [Microscillaceae bacterium]|nr:hypothetical protein [Microscillaceae bacterium]